MRFVDMTQSSDVTRWIRHVTLVNGMRHKYEYAMWHLWIAWMRQTYEHRTRQATDINPSACKCVTPHAGLRHTCARVMSHVSTQWVKHGNISTWLSRWGCADSLTCRTWGEAAARAGPLRGGRPKIPIESDYRNGSYHTLKHTETHCNTLQVSIVASTLIVIIAEVSFAKEPYKRDDILQKRPIIL